MISHVLGFDAAIAFLPRMIHMKFEVCQGVGARGSLSPIGTRVDEHASAFERGENEMNGSGVGDAVGRSGFGGELLNVSDPSIKDLHVFIRIPVRAQPVTIVFKRFLCHNVVA